MSKPKQETSATWAEHVERWKRSGLPAKEFAAGENLSARSLAWWKWQLGRRARLGQAKSLSPRRPKAKKTFLPVVVKPPIARATSIEIVVRENVRLRVSHGFDVALLAQVVAALGGDS